MMGTASMLRQQWYFSIMFRREVQSCHAERREASGCPWRQTLPEGSNPVMLSIAKHLAAHGDRPFASLRVTWCDCSNFQGLFFTFKPCLNCISMPACLETSQGRQTQTYA